ncbi:MAG: hypothetical protein HUJ53_07745 [Holdemanella sp.]|nr:hypothetical protein [Holdemanella sp.]
MHDRILGIIIGFFGLLVFCVLVFYSSKRNRNKNIDKYDERQLAARGKAYKAGYLALMLYFGLLTAAYVAEIDIPDKYNIPILFGGICFGLGVFCVVAINNDAYIALNEKRGSQMTTLILLTVANILIAAANIIINNKSGIWITNIFVALLGFIILAAILIRQKKADKEDAE